MGGAGQGRSQGRGTIGPSSRSVRPRAVGVPAPGLELAPHCPGLRVLGARRRGDRFSRSRVGTCVQGSLVASGWRVRDPGAMSDDPRAGREVLKAERHLDLALG